jgi:methyltransferase (TIGR00027 family)
MKAGRASVTAQMVAFWRALADGGATSIPGFHDPIARRMLGRTGRWMLGRTERRMARMSPAERMRFGRAFEGVTLRVATIDRELVRAAADGVRQVVILGAGFDTRAWRMAELAGSTVFEVDHPATQAAKAERVAGLAPIARLRFVPVDFERDRLEDALANAGHDADAPTIWVIEGVVMYLGDDALRSTLAAVRARSARGSTLVLHYHLPSRTRERRIRKILFQALGEPQIGLRTVETMHAELDRAGFSVERDTDAVEQAAILGAAEPGGDLARVSRVAVAAPREADES